MYRFFRKNREAVKKYLLIFFLSIVSIGMVITLAPIPTGDTNRTESNVLASLDGSHITTQELQQYIQKRLRNSSAGNDMNKIVPVVAGGILDEMVLNRALINEAGEMGITVSDEELAETLQSLPWLQLDGKFIGIDRYQDVISQQTGMSVAEFEEQMRNRLLMGKVRSVVTAGVGVTPQEVRQEFQRRNAKAKIAYVLFDPSQFIKSVQASPEVLEAFFKKSPEHYKVPEQRKVRYVLIDADHVRAQVKVTDDDAQQYYSQHLSSYRVPDRVKVAHILFKTGGKSPAEAAEIEKTARDVQAQLSGGANFSDLAKKHSEDTTASNGGELGWVMRGQTVKEFEDAAFSMKPGQVSGLIKTEYGFHILKLEDKQTAHLESFAEVKSPILVDLTKQRGAEAQDQLSSSLAKQLALKPDAFVEVARKAGLEPQESPLFKYGQPVADLGNGEAFENLAFQLRRGEVGTPITVPKGQVIIQLAEIVPEHLPAFEEVRAQVEEDYRAEQSKILAAQKAVQFAAQAKTGDFAKIAKAGGLAPKESKDFTQQDSVEGLGAGSQLAAAFTLNPGQTSGVVSLGGNSAVFRVISHTPANNDDFVREQGQVTEELLGSKRALAFDLYRQNLKLQLMRSGKLKMNPGALKTFIALYQNR